MRFEEVQRFALSLADTTEEPHFDKVSFRVRDRIFATVSPDREYLHLFVDEDEIPAAVARYPLACEELWWGKRLVGVRIALAAADSEAVCELLQDAWRHKSARRRVVSNDDGTP